MAKSVRQRGRAARSFIALCFVAAIGCASLYANSWSMENRIADPFELGVFGIAAPSPDDQAETLQAQPARIVQASPLDQAIASVQHDPLNHYLPYRTTTAAPQVVRLMEAWGMPSVSAVVSGTVPKGSSFLVEDAVEGAFILRSLQTGDYLACDGTRLILTPTAAPSVLWSPNGSGFTSLSNLATGVVIGPDADISLSMEIIKRSVVPEENGHELLVEAILQYPELPTGCEVVALTTVLGYLGFDADKMDVAEEHLPTSRADFVHSFMGDPADVDGLGIMAPGLTEAANDFLQDNASDLEARDVSGRDFEELLAYIDDGKPVIVWTTIDLWEPGEVVASQEDYTLFDNTHTVVLTGYDRTNGTVVVADPLVGTVERERTWFEELYDLMGRQAVVIV